MFSALQGAGGHGRRVFPRILLAAVVLLPLLPPATSAQAPAAARAAQPDPLVTTLVAQARTTGQPPAFERTIVATRNGETTTRVERFDPARPAGERWALVSINGAPPSAGEARSFARQMAETTTPGYWRMALLLGQGATRAGGTETEPVLVVRPLPDGVLDGQARAFARQLRAEVRVATASPAFIRETRVLADGPLRRGPARVEDFEAMSRYAPGPGGAPRLEAQSTRMTIRVLGQEIRVATRTSYRYL
jgi:hypothetical protein